MKLRLTKGKGIKVVEYDLTTVSMCCTHPPSADGSLCAGGNCACTEDYTCERCENEEDRII